MPEVTALKLHVVDGLRLPAEYRAALMPGGTLRDNNGHSRVLPRFFYEIPSWEAVKEAQLTTNLSLWEFIVNDVREAEVLRDYPRYIPCAVTLLAMALQRFRDKVGSIHVSANGGYRSPKHQLTVRASLHCWATAADIYRVGDNLLDTRERIERYSAIARDVIPGGWSYPAGTNAEETDDHLHIDVGYVDAVPHHIRVDSGLLSEVTA